MLASYIEIYKQPNTDRILLLIVQLQALIKIDINQ